MDSKHKSPTCGTDRVEMAAQEIHFQGDSATSGRNGRFSPARTSQQLLFIRSHSSSHQLCTERQVPLSPGNKESCAPAGEAPLVIGQACMGSALPCVACASHTGKGGTRLCPQEQSFWLWTERNEARGLSLHSVAAVFECASVLAVVHC